MKHTICAIVFVLLAITIQAQRVTTVCGEYRYTVPGEIPLNRAKQIAIDKARNEAIANEFGQVVSLRALSMAICFALFSGISPGTI